MTWAFSATRVGRKDYSQNIEISVEKEIRSLQQRFFFSNRFPGLATFPAPVVYETALLFLINGALQYEAPLVKPWLFYLLDVTGDDQTAIAYASLVRYPNYATFLTGPVLEYCGTALGIGEARVEFTKGLTTVAGSVYGLQFALHTANPTFDADLVIHGIIGAQEEI